MNANDLREAAFLLAPGFLTLKLFQQFGAQRKRSEWEWTVWSVLVSLVIDVLTKDPAAKLLVALALGLGLVAVWRYAGRQTHRISRWVRRELVESAWDHTLDEAARNGKPIEVVTEDRRFFGRLATFALEEKEAEPWLYLRDVSEASLTNDDWTRLTRTHGVMLHREHIRRLRVIEPRPRGSAEG